jgi:hypothetical protein
MQEQFDCRVEPLNNDLMATLAPNTKADPTFWIAQGLVLAWLWVSASTASHVHRIEAGSHVSEHCNLCDLVSQWVTFLHGVESPDPIRIDCGFLEHHGDIFYCPATVQRLSVRPPPCERKFPMA